MILKNINKSYDNVIFKDFNFECQNNDFVLIVGQSGVGKTTLLNIIAGLTDYVGEIKEVGEVSYMMQEDVFLENLSVLDNIRLATKKSEKEITELAKNLKISRFLKSKPCELSGGMARRASFIRAVLFNKPTLLLDEPTNSLDFESKKLIVNELQRQLELRPRLTICVTHDFESFKDLATRIIELK